ncbi:SDR family NAD(P)-dependent oxidoreductase [Paraburkholderia youngii]|uniref:SDR family NAD(P)-dependent oxidoreductase n=1 Tax=Paraburkholderia youngii TaxID=2782701 RepID=UPI003D1FEA3F
MKTWFITGASRGFGLGIAREALEAGDQVVATARQPGRILDALSGYGNRLLAIALDVADPSSPDVAVKQALDCFGRIDVLVNNAGYGQLGAFEEVAREDLIRQFETNVYGVFDVTRAILPTMRGQRSGHVITISSIAGISGGAGSSLYSATKHAVGGWSEALSQEVEPFGIKVTCVYPGRFRTDFLDASSVRYGSIPIDDYAELSASRKKALDDNNHLQAGDPSAFARAIFGLSRNEHAPIWLGAGSEAYRVFIKKSNALYRNAEEWKALTVSLDVVEDSK